jgi:hypothetical protein
MPFCIFTTIIHEPEALLQAFICVSRKNVNRLYLAVDVDDPTRPCELCEVEIEGEW